MLYQLSYASLDRMERETGIEPATNSLEGCDSTIELLPPVKSFNILHCRTMDIQAAKWSRMEALCTKGR